MPYNNVQLGLAEISSDDLLTEARKVFDAEIAELTVAKNNLSKSFVSAVNMILNTPGKVIFTGAGKSGMVAQKISASFRSVGIPAFYINCSDALHGDLGGCSEGDVAILISNSGVTEELVRMIPVLKSAKIRTIAIVGNLTSFLSQNAEVSLNATVSREADPLNLVPTSSTTVAMVIGHALLCVLMKVKDLSKEEFSAYHPAGLLGRSLSLRVEDVMHGGPNLPWVREDTPIVDVITEISDKSLGAVCVLDEERHLLGLITDGDVRRGLQLFDDIKPLTARSLMTSEPITVSLEVVLRDALTLMEDRPSQLSVLPVIGPSGICLGLIRLHDIFGQRMV